MLHALSLGLVFIIAAKQGRHLLKTTSRVTHPTIGSQRLRAAVHLGTDSGGTRLLQQAPKGSTGGNAAEAEVLAAREVGREIAKGRGVGRRIVRRGRRIGFSTRV